MSDRPEPIERQLFELPQLVKDHPPLWNDRNKQIVFAIACGTEASETDPPYPPFARQ